MPIIIHLLDGSALPGDHPECLRSATMATSEDSVSEDGNGVSRRNVLRGAAGIGAVIGAGGLIDVGFEQRALAAPDPGNTTVPLPTTTAPEQLHLTWGADPKTQ